MNLEKSNQLLELNNKLIPGGKILGKINYFEQGKTPFSFERGKGVSLWDVDGNAYTDFTMSLGTILLGYSFEGINQAIAEQLKNGISFSLATELEVKVAQQFVDLIPCAEMVRYGKNASDVLASAVKLSRYITGRDHVVVSGFHGIHDWAVGTTSRAGGIPDSIKNLSHKIKFNDIDSLDLVIKQFDGEISCVILDPIARHYPKPGYLEEVREITKKHGIMLIFDEVITGFRVHPSGAQGYFGVTPDMACFGKAIANGMPLSVLAGKAEYIERSNEIFYSLTFAGETLSLAAANKALEIYKKDITKGLHKKGEYLKQGLQKVFAKHRLSDIFEIQGMAPRPIVGLKNTTGHPFFQKEGSVDQLMLFMIEYLAQKNILYNSSIFICAAHTYEDLDYLITNFDSLCEALQAQLFTQS